MRIRNLWIVLALLTGGCQTPIEFGLNGIGLMSYVGTGKGLSDHVISFVAGRDCSMRGLIYDGQFCRDPEEVPPEAQAAEPVYCYRTLAAVECYTQPDPFSPPSRRLN